MAQPGNAALTAVFSALLQAVLLDAAVPDWFSHAGRESKSFELKTKGFCNHAVASLKECTEAGERLKLADPIAHEDGQAGATYDPPHCYFEENSLLFNEGGTNAGMCTDVDVCVCKKTKKCGPGDLNNLNSWADMQKLWHFDMTNPHMTAGCGDDVRKKCHTGWNWYGWSGNERVGTMSAMLFGEGKVTVNFGNCWDAGVVNVYKNGQKIASAGPGITTSVTFDFVARTKLELKDEEGNAVIQLNGVTFMCDECFQHNTAKDCPDAKCSWDGVSCRPEDPKDISELPKGQANGTSIGMANKTKANGTKTTKANLTKANDTKVPRKALSSFRSALRRHP